MTSGFDKEGAGVHVEQLSKHSDRDSNERY
jgi:hypothetical protein